MRGTVLFGINTIYTVLSREQEYQCRIKGKKLKSTGRWYNPLAPGDEVEFEMDPLSDEKGAIVERHERQNYFSRWNKKTGSPQILSANIDQAVIVAAADSPPFRPRFVDRVLIMALKAGIPAVIVLNKTDIGVPESVTKRLSVYEGLGYPVFLCSALTGAGLPAIENLIKGKRSLFVGPSGTGKSSLVNRLIPEAAQRTGRISEKFNRGTHTTCFAVLLKGKADTECIDTPGIREVHVYDVEAAALKGYFPEFHALEASCAFQPCLHSEEDDCAVKKAAETGAVDPERYDSYLRILSALQEGPGDRNG